jgi:hypothetical protein
VAAVVEPVLGEEKLRALLAEGHEQSVLDFKTQLDLNERHDVIELAKDVAAMQAEESGGYLVIGVDDRGKPVSDLTAGQAKLFDEATLRSKLKKFIAEPFDVRTATHVIDGNTVVLVYVAPNVEGWCIFAATGEYYEPIPGSTKTRPIVVFRRGDVFVRHGTASERWQDADRSRLLQRAISRRKEAWRAEFRAEFLELVGAGRDAQEIERMPSTAVTGGSTVSYSISN